MKTTSDQKPISVTTSKHATGNVRFKTFSQNYVIFFKYKNIEYIFFKYIIFNINIIML